jgi:DNA (cytosine-5)-methyltransferase 1
MTVFCNSVNPRSLKGYKFIDLFAGIGGIRKPFDELGAQCVFSSELDKYAKKTYTANYTDIPHGDITQIDEQNIPAFDILLAGFSCQPFSYAGHKKGFDDTRGTLFFDICRIVNYHKPKILFLENVKGFKSHNQGKTFSTVKNTLSSLGYNIYTAILNARQFGVPQNRERLYIVAFKESVEFSFPEPTNQSVKVGDILSKEVDEKYTISDRLWSSHKRRKLEHKAKGNGFGYSLFQHNSKYTSTMSARYYKDGSEILIDQGDKKNPRKITPREAAKLQGFPDSFVIPVSDTQAYRQFGNSVAIPVIRAIAKEISKSISTHSF